MPSRVNEAKINRMRRKQKNFFAGEQQIGKRQLKTIYDGATRKC